MPAPARSAAPTSPDDVSPVPAAAPARRAGGVLRRIGTGLSAAAFILVLGLGVLVVGIPAAVGGTALTILTGSMSPGLPAGTLVVVKPTPPDEIRVGDVLTFQLESGRPALVTHRVIARSVNTATGELSFTTRGDANEVADRSPVLPVQIRGTVWYSVPLLGWVNQAVNGEARGWIVPVAAGGLFVYALWLVGSGVRDRRRSRHSRFRPPS